MKPFARLVCLLFGHRAECAGPGVDQCCRCGSICDWYGEGRIWTKRDERGLLEPLWVFWRRLRQWSCPRCRQCGRALWFRGMDGGFCSKECHDAWLPF